MKRFLLLVFLVLLPCILYSHPGGTNSEGCHTNHKTGEYHCRKSSTSKKSINTYLYKKNKDDLRIISWNIQDLGKTKNEDEILFIAKTINQADIVAIQEVVSGYGGAKAVARLATQLNRMGGKWDYRISEPTKGPGIERYAFLWRTNKATLQRNNLSSFLEQKIDREPYMAWFESKNTNILLFSFHAVPTKKKPAKEIIKVSMEPYLKNYDGLAFVMGDFNLSYKHSAFTSFKNLGLKHEITEKTSLKKKRKNGNYRYKQYDNIWTNSIIRQAGVIDFVTQFDTLKKAREISDHLPVFVDVLFND